MHSLWLVAKHEYERIALRRAFLIVTFAIPLLLVLVVGAGFLIQTAGQSKAPVGYVDLSGILVESRQSTLPDAGKRVQIRAFADQQAALSALQADQIQAFWVIPAGYPATLNTELYYLSRAPSSETWGEFDDFVRANLVAAYPEAVQQRLLEGPSVTVHDIASGRDFGGSSAVNIVLPIVATVVFFLATMSAGGYMLQIVTDEKENRTMEVLVTSLTPGQLIGGKALGLLGATLTQLAVILVVAAIALVVAAPRVPFIQQLTVPWGYVGILVLFFLPTYALVSATMIAIGSAVSEVQQGQQIAGILSLLFMLPVFMVYLILENPGSPIVVLFSLFPAWSFVTISLRWGLGTVPLWQLVVAWALLVAATGLALWTAARLFRAGMLRYGQPLSWKSTAAALRGE